MAWSALSDWLTKAGISVKISGTLFFSSVLEK
jgi:hypothetical protein